MTNRDEEQRPATTTSGDAPVDDGRADSPGSGETRTGVDPDAEYTEPGYQDKSLGQAVNQDAELADRLTEESATVEEASDRFAEGAVGAPALDERSGAEPAVPDPDALLHTYLADHLAGAAAGIEVARRSRDQNEGTEFAEFLSGLHNALCEHRSALERITSDIGHHPSRVKDTLGVLGAKLGALKLSGRIVRYSPLSRVEEFEMLASGLESQLRLWRGLAFVQPAGGTIDPDELERLAERTSGVLNELLPHHRAAMLVAFSGSADES